MLINPIKNDKYISISSTSHKEALWEAARKGELRAVADASYSPMFSTTMAAAAWLMETKKQRFSWNGSGLCTAKYNSSYGGEIYGIYLILRFLNEIWPDNDSKKGSIHIKCDNLEGVKDSSYNFLKISRSKKFLGLLRAIRKHTQELRNRGLNCIFGHIKGHQDDTSNYQWLDRWAQMNVLADLAAKKCLQE